MNNKISFPELVELLSKSTNASKKTCEAFLKSFFGAIEDALAAGETVKIKNLGVFKVAKVEARKSVHVNTGEEIEIPEHNKIISGFNSQKRNLMRQVACRRRKRGVCRI